MNLGLSRAGDIRLLPGRDAPSELPQKDPRSAVQPKGQAEAW